MKNAPDTATKKKKEKLNTKFTENSNGMPAINVMELEGEYDNLFRQFNNKKIDLETLISKASEILSNALKSNPQHKTVVKAAYTCFFLSRTYQEVDTLAAINAFQSFTNGPSTAHDLYRSSLDSIKSLTNYMSKKENNNMENILIDTLKQRAANNQTFYGKKWGSTFTGKAQKKASSQKQQTLTQG